VDSGKRPRVIIIFPFRGIIGVIYVFFAFVLLLISSGYFTLLFKSVGLPAYLSYLLATELAFLSLILSPVNVVLKEINREAIIPEIDVYYVFGIPLYFPRLAVRYRKTLVAINLGGAVIPLSISLLLVFLVYSSSLVLLLLLLFDVLIITLVSNSFAKVVNGVGVVMNPLIAPITSSLTSVILFYTHASLIPVSAYISSVLGTLIGADLLNLKKIISASPQMISIGGMGTFDGIFLSGLFSVMIGEFLMPIARI